MLDKEDLDFMGVNIPLEHFQSAITAEQVVMVMQSMTVLTEQGWKTPAWVEFLEYYVNQRDTKKAA